VRPKASTAALIAALACASPAALHAALAGAAGTVFEAAPFVLGSWFLTSCFNPPGRLSVALRRAVGFLGCGCGGAPGALAALPFALCWLAVGPLPALARAAGALAVLRLRDGRGHAGEPADPLETLAGLVPFALAGALLDGVLPAWHLPPAAAFAGGALAGALAPCTAGSVALAAALAATSPAAAAGLLATAGIVPPPAGHGSGGAPGRWPAAALALACALLAWRHGAGFVHPRLVAPVAAAALGAAVAAVRGGRARIGAGWLGPAVALAALIAGSPAPPLPPADATAPAGGFAGQPVRFVGVARRDGGATALVRYAITCCRADARAIALRLDHRANVPDGTWLAADGVLAQTPTGLVLHARSVTRIAAPADPYVYR